MGSSPTADIDPRSIERTLPLTQRPGSDGTRQKAAFEDERLARPSAAASRNDVPKKQRRAHPDLNQGPADLQSAALTTELCTHVPCRQRAG